MDMKINMGIPLVTFLLLLLVSIISSSHSLSSLDANSTELSFHNLFSSTVFPLKKEPHRHGGYTVSLKIGDPVKSFNLYIDTGSDLTWVQCDFDKCIGCTMPENKLYKLEPKDKRLVLSGSNLCTPVQKKPRHPNFDPFNPCEYHVGYPDSLETQGVLVKDSIPIESSDRTLQRPELAFGCSNKLKASEKEAIPEGILGLGNGEASILFQLKSKGLIQNVVGHCLSDEKNGGGGYLFFGDKFILNPPTQISWTPMQNPPKNKEITEAGRYFAGPANLIFNEKPTFIKDLHLMFDCGTTYSYFNSKDYKVLYDLINNELNLKGRRFTHTEEDNLICWKGGKSFESIGEVKDRGYLKPIILSFSNNKVQFQLLVEHYITLSRNGNICMAIEDSSVNGLDDDDNVIGAVAMHNKIMIFDNDKKQIGWLPNKCDKLPKSLIN